MQYQELPNWIKLGEMAELKHGPLLYLECRCHYSYSSFVQRGGKTEGGNIVGFELWVGQFSHCIYYQFGGKGLLDFKNLTLACAKKKIKPPIDGNVLWMFCIASMGRLGHYYGCIHRVYSLIL